MNDYRFYFTVLGNKYATSIIANNEQQANELFNEKMKKSITILKVEDKGNLVDNIKDEKEMFEAFNKILNGL